MQAYLANLAGAAPLAAELAVKGAIWLAAILVLTLFFRSASAATRHLVWAVGLAGLFALPFLSDQLPWRIAVPLAVAPDAHRAQREPSGDAPTSPVPVLRTDAANGAALTQPLGSIDPPATAAATTAITANALATAPFPLGTVLLVVWSVGALLLLIRLARSVASVGRILAHATPCPDARLASLSRVLAKRVGVRRLVGLLTAESTPIPFTSGAFRPVIVLPAGAETWSVDKQEAVLLHELAHVARLDLLTSFAAHVACALHWFNPLVWVAARKMRLEGECACDDAVLRFGTRASDYADQLLQVVRDTKNRWAPAVAVAMARRSAFEGRLLAILAPDVNRQRLTARYATLVALGVALLTLPIAAMSARVSTAGNSPNEGSEQLVSDAAEDTLTVLSPTAASRNAEAAQAQDTAPRAAVTRGLTRALRDGDEGVRLAAVEALKSRQERSVLLDLIPLLSDSSSDVRRAAVEALSSMPDPRAIAALVRALRTDSDPRVRELAAQALGNIDDESAVPGLISALREERVTAVRRNIVHALAEIESQSAAGALGDALRDDDAEMRQYAIEGLGSLKVRSVIPQIIPLLRDSNADVRAKAAWALGELKSFEALDALMGALSDANADVRQQAVNALGSLESPRALPALLRALRDTNVDVRREAINAIHNIEDIQRAPSELIEALSDADVEVRESALRALSHIKDPSSVGAIIPFTRSGQPFAVREAAIEALSEIGGNQVEPVLLQLMQDSDPKVRRLAAQGLGKE